MAMRRPEVLAVGLEAHPACDGQGRGVGGEGPVAHDTGSGERSMDYPTDEPICQALAAGSQVQ